MPVGRWSPWCVRRRTRAVGSSLQECAAGGKPAVGAWYCISKSTWMGEKECMWVSFPGKKNLEEKVGSQLV